LASGEGAANARVMGWHRSTGGRNENVGGDFGILAEVQIETPSLSLRLSLALLRLRPRLNAKYLSSKYRVFVKLSSRICRTAMYHSKGPLLARTTMDTNLKKILDELPDKPPRSRLEPYREFITILKVETSGFQHSTARRAQCIEPETLLLRTGRF
jgi:hypothetical protein